MSVPLLGAALKADQVHRTMNSPATGCYFSIGMAKRSGSNPSASIPVTLFRGCPPT